VTIGGTTMVPIMKEANVAKQIKQIEYKKRYLYKEMMEIQNTIPPPHLKLGKKWKK
jgi:hypothetical protein